MLAGIPLRHEQEVQDQQDEELQDFQNVPRLRHDEPVLVKKRSLPGVVESDGLLLVPVRNQVYEAGRRIHNLTLVDAIDSAPKCETAILEVEGKFFFFLFFFFSFRLRHIKKKTQTSGTYTFWHVVEPRKYLLSERMATSSAGKVFV